VEKMDERNPLSNLVSYANVRETRRLVEELEKRERSSRDRRGRARDVDVLLLRRRRRLYLDQEGARLFARYYWCIMAYEENSYLHQRQMRVLRKMLVKKRIQ